MSVKGRSPPGASTGPGPGPGTPCCRPKRRPRRGTRPGWCRGGVLDLGRVGQRVHHDVERRGPEVLLDEAPHSLDAEIPDFLVALVLTDLRRGVAARVVGG